jgi:hypothetical protein
MKIRKSLLVEAAKDRPQGYLEDVYSHVESEDMEFVYISNDNYILLKNKYMVEHGLPGTELQKLISWFYTPSKKCKCATRIAKMNAWGPDKCEENIDTIMRWLKHSAAINSVPYVESAVRVLVWIAIRKARKYV